MADAVAWRETLRLSELRGKTELRLTPPPEQLPAIAKAIGADELKSLSAEVTVAPWMDGAELRGTLRAEVVQTCGVTLDPIEETVAGVFQVRVLPAGSPNLPDPEADIDPEGDDPPDALEGDDLDLAAYVVEHLALEIDPFPRKPDAVFEAPAGGDEASPFAALKALKRDDR